MKWRRAFLPFQERVLRSILFVRSYAATIYLATHPDSHYVNHMVFFSEKCLMPSFLTHFRVIQALILRDLKTRMGGSYFGFAFGLLLPLGHISVVLAVYLIMGRRAALGTDSVTYLSTAITPFIIWSYTHQKMMQAFNQNSPLLSFPIVRINDIMIARSCVEMLESTLIVSVTLVSINLLNSDLFIYDRTTSVFALFLSYLFGVSTGYFFGIVSILLPPFIMIGYFLIPINWFISGVFFMPESLPDQFRWIISWFPLSHIVDIMRVAIYPNYINSFNNINYVVICILGNIFFTISIEKLTRTKLLST